MFVHSVNMNSLIGLINIFIGITHFELNDFVPVEQNDVSYSKRVKNLS